MRAPSQIWTAAPVEFALGLCFASLSFRADLAVQVARSLYQPISCPTQQPVLGRVATLKTERLHLLSPRQLNLGISPKPIPLRIHTSSGGVYSADVSQQEGLSTSN